MSEIEYIAPGAEFAEEVAKNTREGHLVRANRVFTRGWRDAVPDLPLRFSVVLVRPDRKAVTQLDRRLRDEDEPQMQLCRQDAGAVEVTVDGQRIGDLPADDARLLAELDAAIDLYSPRVLEIRYTTRGRLDYIAVELVRPEVRLCSSCNLPHTGTHVNCDRCRAKRYR